MASLGDVLVTKILGHSDAEKAFRPWWDNLEDFLVYGLVMLGLIVAPTAIIMGTPLDCNFCQANHCQGRFAPNATDDYNKTDPDFNAWWVKKYCTMTAVDGFVLYFPYILLIMALVIVLTERVFIRIFKAGLKLDMFYNLLVKESIESSDPSYSDVVDLENTKQAIEVSHSFASGSNYFKSYFLRSLIEFILASALLAWLVIRGFPSIQKEEFIYCDVHGYRYECAGHPQQFYMYVLFVAIAILLVYLLCCLYNILWVLFPRLGTLSKVMRVYRRELRKTKSREIATDKELLGTLYEAYYNNRDLKLLLDLLAESSGIAPSLRVLTLFDKEFRMRSEPSEFQVYQQGNVVEVEFGEAETIQDIFSLIKEVSCIYTVEILPATPQSTVMAFKHGEAGTKRESIIKESKPVDDAGDVELQPLGSRIRSSKFKRTIFRDLDPSKEYTIRVCTVVNGRAIARKTKAIRVVCDGTGL